MRKLKLQMQTTVDGYVAGLNGELDWMQWNWDDELKKYVSDLTEPVDCILLGRKMADGFISHWSSVITDPQNPEFAFGKKMCDALKIVFSKTLDKATWQNTRLANGNLIDEIGELKAQAGGDIIVYGGSNFVSNLIKHNLIDEYYLFVNPTALGKGNGLTIFSDRTKLDMIQSHSFECGVVLLNYKTARS